MKASTLVRLIASCSIVILALGLLIGVISQDRSQRETSQPLITANGLQQNQSAPPTDTPDMLPVDVPTSIKQAPPVLTSIQHTEELPPAPTRPVPTDIPTRISLQPAEMRNPDVVSQISQIMTATLSVKTEINQPNPISSMAWAPTGDKLLYVTNFGDLYWSNVDGSNSTFLHHYGETWNLLDDQMPLSNTLFLRHRDENPHMDIIRFQPGQAPTIEEDYETGTISNVYWWSPTRVSGIRNGSETLVTLDADGHVVERREIPYILNGAVRPGGEWLAYVTTQASTIRALNGATGSTAYLLNLKSGQRIQISGEGMARHVHGWSPNGNWLMMDAKVGNICGPVLISADGREAIVLSPACGYGLYDAVWSPDSKRVAFSIRGGGCDDPHTTPCPPYMSKVYMVDIPTRKLMVLEKQNADETSPVLMMKPAWSPDGSLLALLSYDPDCEGDCSGLTPAIYVMNAP